MDAKRDNGAYLKFEDFVDFIGVISSEMCDPVWSLQARNERKKSVVTHATLHEHRENKSPTNDKDKKAKKHITWFKGTKLTHE